MRLTTIVILKLLEIHLFSLGSSVIIDMYFWSTFFINKTPYMDYYKELGSKIFYTNDYQYLVNRYLSALVKNATHSTRDELIEFMYLRFLIPSYTETNQYPTKNTSK